MASKRTRDFQNLKDAENSNSSHKKMKKKKAKLQSTSSLLPELLPNVLSFIPHHKEMRLINKEWDVAYQQLHSRRECSDCKVIAEDAHDLMSKRNAVPFMKSFQLQLQCELPARPQHILVQDKSPRDTWPTLLIQLDPNCHQKLENIIKAIQFSTELMKIGKFRSDMLISLDGFGIPLTDASEFVSFIDSPYVKYLTSLPFEAEFEEVITVETMNKLFSSPNASNIHTLTLNGFKFEPAVYEALFNSSFFEQIKYLSLLRNVALNNETFAHIASHGHNLTSLIVESNSRTSSESVQLLTCSESFSKLEALQIIGLDLAGMKHIASPSSTLTSLIDLDLQFGEFLDEGLELLASPSCPLSSSLQHLHLECCQLTADSIQTLTHFTSLMSLTIAGNLLENEDIIQFAESHSLMDLRVIDVTRNNVERSGLLALLSTENFPKLMQIDVDDNDGIGEDETINRIAEEREDFTLTINDPTGGYCNNNNEEEEAGEEDGGDEDDWGMSDEEDGDEEDPDDETEE